MSIFADPEAAERGRDRLSTLTGLALGSEFEALFRDVAHPDGALAALEQWLRKTGNPATLVEALQSSPGLASALLNLIGSSRAQADALIQNPEFGAFALDPQALNDRLTLAKVKREGLALLRSSSSYSHSLDRLRFLRQRWTLAIALNDLTGAWEPEVVWAAISDLAEALLALACDVVWQDVSKSGESCPVLVVGFGKLGGRELNYSSDIDLVYATQDEVENPHFERFAAALGRAVGERMGRGMLYRVDARLRPYGAAGALTPSLRAVEAYYERYAEPWEVQALLRSRPMAGPADLAERWEAMRRKHCFKPTVSEFFLDELIANRNQIEEHGDPDDIKRGPGGIRDVEFLVQMRQLAGQGREEMSTLPALRLLKLALEHRADLESAYTFLRQLEHRIQLLDDQQTHRLPQSLTAREAIAHLLRFPSEDILEARLALHRSRVRQIYRNEMMREAIERDDRHEVASILGEDGAVAVAWMDRLPGSELYYRALLENEHSLGRLALLLEQAPALVPLIREDLALTEELLSGEIEEPRDPDLFSGLAIDAAPAALASVYRRGVAGACFRWLLDPYSDLSQELGALADALLRRLAGQLALDFDVVALGSYATGELGFGSDLDLLLLCPTDERRTEAEGQAEGLLALLSALRRHGAPIEVDLRLRPEGGKGLLVRSYAGFEAYDMDGMEMWERLALGSARSIWGSPTGRAYAIKAAYALPLTPPRLKELVAMKKRIESERVAPQHLWRNVKLGHGGLSDIEWLVRLHELRYPTATLAGKSVDLDDRLEALAQARLLNVFELEILRKGRSHLAQVRRRLDFLGFRHDTVPENPDKLRTLAHHMEFADGNAFLAEHETIRHDVRSLYLEALERLRA